MKQPLVSDVAFSPAVKAQQERLGSRAGYARMEQKRGWKNLITPDLAAFIAQVDSFYLGTANAAGQPYIQHRGGPTGFLKVLDEQTLALADFSGNRQYITIGNLSENERVFVFLMDYPNQQRIKIWGRARFVENDPQLLAQVMPEGYDARPERVLLIVIDAWDANCPQHINRRYSEDQVALAVGKLQNRIAELEAEVSALRRAQGPRSEAGDAIDKR